MVGTVRVQRPCALDIPVRRKQQQQRKRGRRHRALRVPGVSTPGGSGQGLRQAEGRRGLSGATLESSLRGRAQGATGQARPHLRLRPLHRAIRRVLFRLHKSGVQRRDVRGPGRLRAHFSAGRFENHFFR